MHKSNNTDEIMGNKKLPTYKNKRQYHSPLLLKFGSIQSNTASGSEPRMEGRGKGNFMRRA